MFYKVLEVFVCRVRTEERLIGCCKTAVIFGFPKVVEINDLCHARSDKLKYVCNLEPQRRHTHFPADSGKIGSPGTHASRKMSPFVNQGISRTV